MPLPLIAFGVAALLSAVGTTVAVRQLRQPLKVMVIGQTLTGKTTLLNSWLGEWEDDPLRTGLPIKIAKLEVPVKEKVLNIEKKFIFKKVKDISGQDESMRGFLDDVKAATAIVYLVNAVDLYREEGRPAGQPHAIEWIRVMDDASRIKRHCGKAKRVIVGVTHTDLDPRFAALGPPTYLAKVTDQLAPALSKIDESVPAAIVAGSLRTEESAAAFAEQVVGKLL